MNTFDTVADKWKFTSFKSHNFFRIGPTTSVFFFLEARRISLLNEVFDFVVLKKMQLVRIAKKKIVNFVF